MELELKACPFCGQERANLYRSQGRRGVFLYVKCAFCGAQAKTYGTPLDFNDPGIWDSAAAELSAMAWNTRGGAMDA